MLWMALVAAMIFGTAVEWHGPNVSRNQIAALPSEGYAFSSRAIPLSPEETEFYGQARVMKRLYRCRSDAFILIALDGSANRHAVHDPLYCLKGSGWEITDRRALAVDGGTAERLTLSGHGERRQAVFWFSDGFSRHPSVLRYWLQTTLRRMTFGRSGNEPVMVILQSAGNEPPDWRMLLDRCLFLYEI
ncbi:exosortase-associated EpsI family protein [Chlorobium sp. N1]|uniref:exosortase-associated EpsI family protein n=1 Tax=Chlorobium sp. N1 TaxID=2491138 RepID=UPI0013F176D7|nr:exosortase-associated EpsI family protein [Chlorobium sp. N1]